MSNRDKTFIKRMSEELTFGKLSVGGGKRRQRSRRLELYGKTSGLSPAASRTGNNTLGWMQSRLPLFAIVSTLALLVYGLFGTSWFYIYDIQVEGARFMTKEEIYNRSNVEALHIFWLNPPSVAKQLETDPLVMRAIVSHLPPNRARIQLQERLPVAVWQTDGESYYVDRDGVLFGLRGDARGMLVIRDLSDTPVQPGDTINPEAIRTALELSELLPERRAFDWQNGAGISYLTEEEWQVVFGDHTRLTTKLAAYYAFREQIQPEEKVLVVDLSVPEHPYYRVAQP